LADRRIIVTAACVSPHTAVLHYASASYVGGTPIKSFEYRARAHARALHRNGINGSLTEQDEGEEEDEKEEEEEDLPICLIKFVRASTKRGAIISVRDNLTRARESPFSR